MDNTIITYMLKASVSLILFYGIYVLFLKNDTFLRLRRFYFLFVIFFSIVFPLISIEISNVEEVPVQMPAYWLSEITFDPSVAHNSFDVIFDTQTIIIALLSLVSLLLALRFLFQLLSILKMRFGNDSERFASFHIVKVKNKQVSPFSFFNWVFVNEENEDTKQLTEIIAHEQVHVEQYHSIDVVLVEILCACFWWNPIVWLLKKEMKINLEYLADQGVLRSGIDSKEYQYILLQVSNRNIGIPLINNFNVSQLKKRITMMNKEKTSIGKSFKYLLAIPVVGLLLLGNAVQASPDLIDFVSNEYEAISDIEQAPQKKSDKSQIPQKKGDTYVVVEQMPAYSGGEKAMQNYISNNLKYPTKAVEAKKEGRVTVRYIVKGTGEISNVELVRGVDPELDAEAIRVVKSMPKWIPGKQGGKAVDVYFTLPIVFRLKSDKTNKVSTVDVNSLVQMEKVDGNKPFITVEQMPAYPGGEKAMQNFIQNNLKYSEKAQKGGIQGRVTVRFVVQKTGEVTDVTVIRGLDPELDAEAVRVIKTMPKWVPGKMRGITVPVYYTLPIVYKLTKDTLPAKK